MFKCYKSIQAHSLGPSGVIINIKQIIWKIESFSGGYDKIKLNSMCSNNTQAFCLKKISNLVRRTVQTCLCGINKTIFQKIAKSVQNIGFFSL